MLTKKLTDWWNPHIKTLCFIWLKNNYYFPHVDFVTFYCFIKVTFTQRDTCMPKPFFFSWLTRCWLFFLLGAEAGSYLKDTVKNSHWVTPGPNLRQEVKVYSVQQSDGSELTLWQWIKDKWGGESVFIAGVAEESKTGNIYMKSHVGQRDIVSTCGQLHSDMHSYNWLSSNPARPLSTSTCQGEKLNSIQSELLSACQCRLIQINFNCCAKVLIWLSVRKNGTERFHHCILLRPIPTAR